MFYSDVQGSSSLRVRIFPQEFSHKKWVFVWKPSETMRGLPGMSSPVKKYYSRNTILGSDLFSFNYLKILLHCSLAVSAAVGKSSDNRGLVLRRRAAHYVWKLSECSLCVWWS